MIIKERLLKQFVFLMILTISYSYASSTLQIAVNDFSSKNLPPDQIAIFSDRFRSELLKTGCFRVMERDEMQSILKEQGFQQTGVCDEKSCIVETGKILGVSHIVAGSIGKLGTMFICDVRLINVSTGEIQTTATSDCECTVEMVLASSLVDLAEKLSRSICSAKKQEKDSAGAFTSSTPSVSRSGQNDMVLIAGGTFELGSQSDNADNDEKPLHSIMLDSFWIDTYEVTQSQYLKVMGKNPSYFQNCPRCPVESVSWNDAFEFCKKIDKRLPTEAEWEYAARAGNKEDYFWGKSKEKAVEFAWFEDNSAQRTHPVGTKKSNGYNLFDMSGNVWEWCNDVYDDSYYKNSPVKNPAGPLNGNDHVVRGGAWFYGATSLRVSNREAYAEDYTYRTLGFRCARSNH